MGANFVEGSGIPTEQTKRDEARVASIRSSNKPNAPIENTQGSFVSPTKNVGS